MLESYPHCVTFVASWHCSDVINQHMVYIWTKSKKFIRCCFLVWNLTLCPCQTLELGLLVRKTFGLILRIDKKAAETDAMLNGECVCRAHLSSLCEWDCTGSSPNEDCIAHTREKGGSERVLDASSWVMSGIKATHLKQQFVSLASNKQLIPFSINHLKQKD